MPFRERTPMESEKAWRDHLDRLDSCRLYPSRYPLYLRYHSPGPLPRPLDEAKSFDPHRAWQDHLDRLAEIDKHYPTPIPLSWRHRSPTPIKVGDFSPRPSEVAYNYAGRFFFFNRTHKSPAFDGKKLGHDIQSYIYVTPPEHGLVNPL